jgi:phage shock protein E
MGWLRSRSTYVGNSCAWQVPSLCLVWLEYLLCKKIVRSMAYTTKFQALSDAAMSRVSAVAPDQVDALVLSGAILLDIRDKEEHDADHIANSLHVSRGKLEMNIEGVIPDLETPVLCYCNAYNRGALSADTLRAMGYLNASFIGGGLKAYRAIIPKHL